MTKKILLFTFLLIAIFFTGQFILNNHKPYEKVDLQKEPLVVEQIESEQIDEQEITEYIENITVIDGQPMYYAYPKSANSAKLIIYSHGQLQRITTNLDDPYMLKMREYGEFFALHGFVFSASNQHDDNWGEKDALMDIKNSIKYINSLGEIQILPQKLLVGFSMGGRSAINYALASPDEIEKIALLAPSPSPLISGNSVKKLTNIPIKIWHGEKDINIPIAISQDYVKIFEKHGKEVEFSSVKETDHFELETLMFEDILEFLKD
jgi:predicted esterase